MITDTSSKRYKISTAIIVAVAVCMVLCLCSCTTSNGLTLSSKQDVVKPLSNYYMSHTTNTCYYNWTEYSKPFNDEIFQINKCVMVGNDLRLICIFENNEIQR